MEERPVQKKNSILIYVILCIGLLGVAFPFILILCGLTFFAVPRALSGSRDAARKYAGSEISVRLAEYYMKNGKYPQKLTVDGNRIIIGDANFSYETKGIEIPAKVSAATSTAYCYTYTKDNGYQFGVQLENGTWKNYGTGNCTRENLVGN